MGLIRINYSQAIRESNRLKTVANDCQNANAMVDRLIQKIPTYWQGDAANAFIDKLNEWKRENNSIKTEANNLGTTIKRVADEIREAERRAIAAMKNQ